MKSSFLKIAFPLSVFLFSGCGENKSGGKTDSAAVNKPVVDSPVAIQKPVVVPPRKISENGMAGFYVLNDRNAGTPDAQRLAAWLQPFLDSLGGKDIDGSDNLFNSGSGPMGAQLNPEADLLFTAFFKGKVDTASLTFKMNDFPVLKKMTGVNETTRDGITVCWFLVPRNRYNVMLHLPSEKEKKDICDQKKMDVNSWMKNSCTVMRISAEAKVDGKQVNLENYFIASFVQ